CRTAARPPSPGMAMSVTITSGPRASKAVSSSSPLFTTATTSKDCSSSACISAATSILSSARTTRARDDGPQPRGRSTGGSYSGHPPFTSEQLRVSGSEKMLSRGCFSGGHNALPNGKLNQIDRVVDLKVVHDFILVGLHGADRKP